jgi:hypothetical protein
MTQIIPNTIDEALAAWDAGDEVQTVEMGGMGDGYEMAIQIVAFELLRAMRDDAALGQAVSEIPNGARFPQETQDRLDKVIHALDAKSEETGRYRLGLSGAQAGAAKSLAVTIHRRGYDALKDEEVRDRLIFVRKQDPMKLYRREGMAA